MGSALLNYVQNVWPFSVLRADDLRLSDRQVRRLAIPEHTKQFVFGISEPENGAIVYILCAQNLSERSARDCEYLIKEVRPNAVVALVGHSTLSDIHEHELVEGMGDLVPTSAFRVLMRCFMDKTNREKYENIAGNLVLKEIFGVGFHGHFFAARRLADEVGSSFFVLESPFMKLAEPEIDPSSETNTGNNKFQTLVLQALQPASLVPQNLGPVVGNSRRFFIANDIQSHMVKLLCPSLATSIKKMSPLGSSTETHSAIVEPVPNYCPPPFAEMIYPLLLDLKDIFSDIPSMGRALAYAQKMFLDINKGFNVDTEILSEVFTFQIAVEGLRVALNNAGRLPIDKLGNPKSGGIDFQKLSIEEKSHCVLAYALRNQAKKFKKVVAVVDASGLAGLRKFWNTPIPSEVRDMIEEVVLCHEITSESTKDGERKRLLSAKPVVAVGAGATAIIGASSLSKVPLSTVMKIVTLNFPTSLKLFLAHTHKAVAIALSKFIGPSKIMAPGFKAAASGAKIRAITHSVIASAEKTSFSAMRTAFYEIMRKRRAQPIGFMPWATFGCSVATCGGLLAYGDGIECAAESLPSAPSIANLGRGIQNLQMASQSVRHSCSDKIQRTIESMMSRFKKVKIQ